jgi:hypothetical protein
VKRILVIAFLTFAAATLARADFVHTHGTVLFVDEDGVERPFVRVQVRLMDSDSDYDEEIARGFTDHLGRYSLSGSAGDSLCIGCGKPDPYVKVVLEDPGRVEVHDIMHFTRNAVLTPTFEETAGEIDFGTRTFTEEYPEGMAAILYDKAEHAYNAFVALSGDSKVPGNGGEVAIEIPVVLSFGSPYTTWDTIHWPGVKKKDYDAFYHEFGHRLRHATDGDVAHFNNDLVWYRYGRHHERDEDTNLGFAFNEGWANYFRDRLQPDFLEGSWNGVNQGDEVEGHVSHKLISLADHCGDFKPMWLTLKENPGTIHSFPEFYQKFIARQPRCRLDVPIGVSHLPDPKRRKLKNLPRADSSALAALQQQQKMQIDKIDARAAASVVRNFPRIPASIRAADHGVIERLWQKRLQSVQSNDERARTAYRRLVTGLRPMSPGSIRDGSYQRDALAARRAFINTVARQRLHEAQNIRHEVAAEKLKTQDGALLSYLAALDRRYARLEAELKLALAPTAKNSKLPLGILPRSFSGTARNDR